MALKYGELHSDGPGSGSRRLYLAGLVGAIVVALGGVKVYEVVLARSTQGIAPQPTSAGPPSGPSPGRPALNDIRVPPDGQLRDIALSITAHSVAEDGTCTLVASGLFDSTEVGLRVIVQPRQLSSAADRFAPVDVIIESLGTQSDELLSALAKLHGVPVSTPRMAPRIAALGVTIKGNPRSIRTQALYTKLFLGSDGSSSCEVYLNVIIPAGRLELKEKDADYRPQVIRALSQR